MKLQDIPRVKLTQLPTPIEELGNFSKAIDGPKILMKRDDLTSLCLGGNKARKLEYIMADALSVGADVIITTGGVQTNHGRLTAAACNKLGLKSVLILTGPEPSKYTGNLLLDYLLGADIRFVPPNKNLPKDQREEALKDALQCKIDQVRMEYESKGHKCYYVPLGGMGRVATAGYLNCMMEMQAQLSEMRQEVNYLMVVTGSTSTTSSLILANEVFKAGMKIIGISVWMTTDECKKRILEELEKDTAFYGYNVSFSADEITILDDYIGPGYGIPSKECLRAVKLLAETESIIVDYSYTGKGLAGLIDLTKKGFFSKDDTVLFLHTGGAPAVFNLGREDFEEALK